jgi:type I restriction enzyme S subunit
MSLRLERVASISIQIRGVTYAKGDSSDSQKPGYLPLLRAGNITEAGLVFDDLLYVPSKLVSQKQRLCCGDVLIAASSGSLDVVGKAAAFDLDSEFSFGAFCKVLRPTAEVDARYFSHFFRTASYRRLISQLAAGANINNLKNEHLDELLIPLPSKIEQKRIAAILDKADALRVKRRKALEQLDALAQAIFIEMFGDPVQNPKGIEKIALKEFCTIGTGSTPDRKNRDNYGGTIPWVKTTEVQGGIIKETEEFLTEQGQLSARCKIFPAGSILVALYGQGKTRGQCALLGVEACTNQACGVLQPSPDVDLEFLFYQLLISYESLRALGRGGNQENLNLGLLGGFEVLLPPLIAQREFASKLAAIKRVKENVIRGLHELDALFSSLQHRAFRGEL